MISAHLARLVSPLAFIVASCGSAASGDNAGADATTGSAFTIETVAGFDEPWAMEFDPETKTIFVTEQAGTIRFRTADGRIGDVSGVPEVDYGGQGGLGDFIFAPGESGFSGRTVYLSWAEAGRSGTRGAAVGKAGLTCEEGGDCRLENLEVIWRQQPKVTGRGHYSHRLAFSPDGRYLFVSSGERQKGEPAQDLTSTLGTIVRLLPDGSPAPGNPFADRGAPTDQIWSYGHRNVLGLAFDAQGRLWGLEHGPAGGDELNLVEPGKNYGWPLVSDGDHYNGAPIPRHSTRPDLAAPAISWNPVIAPGNFIFYSGRQIPAWKDQALIANLATQSLVRVAIEGTNAREVARHDFDNRLRDIAEGPDGTIWLIEDGSGPGSGHLLRLVPASATRTAPAN